RPCAKSLGRAAEFARLKEARLSGWSPSEPWGHSLVFHILAHVDVADFANIGHRPIEIDKGDHRQMNPTSTCEPQPGATDYSSNSKIREARSHCLVCGFFK
ncbi:unnamed protein product, partial [marine sediment metagenome]